MIDRDTLTNRAMYPTPRSTASTPCRALTTFPYQGQLVEAGTLIALPGYLADRLIREGVVEAFTACR